MITSTIQCPVCHHEQTTDQEVPVTLADIGEFTCPECRFASVYGTFVPRVVIEPFTDVSGFTWVRHRIQDPVTKLDLYTFDLDPKRAALLASNILSIAVPQ